MGVHVGPEIIGMPFEGHGVTDGLVFYLDAADRASYPGTSGYGTWSDLTGHKNASISTSTTFGTSPDRIIFDNVNGTIGVGPTAWHGTSECTIEMWYYPDAGHTGCCDTVFGRYDFRFFSINQALYLMIAFNDNSSRVYQHPAFGVAEDTWHHCVGMRRGNDYIFWIDGVEKYNGSYGSGHALWAPNSQAWYIQESARHDNEYSILKIYDRGLTDAEILYNYNSQRGRFGV